MDESWVRAQRYAAAKPQPFVVLFDWRLGHGTDGDVWRTSKSTAVKVFSKQQAFSNELECYQRFEAAHVRKLNGLGIPQLEGYDSELLVVEMSVVQPPFLLDFGKVYLDSPPEYWSDSEFRAECFAGWQELFDYRWQEVAAVLAVLEFRFKIYYVDPKPGNIDFGD